MDYPIIIVPTGVDLIIERDDFEFEKPVKKDFVIADPPITKSEEGIWLALGWPVVIISFLLIVFVGIPSLLSNSGDGHLVIMPALFLMIYAFAKYKEEKERIESENYMNKLCEGTYLLAKLNGEANLKVKYDHELKEYYQKLSEYKKHGIEAYKKKLLKECYDKWSFEPKIINTIVKKGKSEKGFYITLREHFGDKISNKFGILHEEGEKTYVPDVVYYNTESNICIDIEIDEKYTSSGEMIHYSGCPHDAKRDDFFVMHNWLVVRYAEKQVLADPLGCIVSLHNILSKYDPCYTPSNKTFSVTKNAPEVNRIKKWHKPKPKINFSNDLPF